MLDEGCQRPCASRSRRRTARAVGLVRRDEVYCTNTGLGTTSLARVAQRRERWRGPPVEARIRSVRRNTPEESHGNRRANRLKCAPWMLATVTSPRLCASATSAPSRTAILPLRGVCERHRRPAFVGGLASELHRTIALCGNGAIGSRSDGHRRCHRRCASRRGHGSRWPCRRRWLGPARSDARLECSESHVPTPCSGLRGCRWSRDLSANARGVSALG